jgi:hypothetical protein
MINRLLTILVCVLCCKTTLAQIKVDIKNFNTANGSSLHFNKTGFSVSWPAGKKLSGELIINLQAGKPLFSSIQLTKNGRIIRVMKDTDPAFLLTIGKRDLVSQNGWNIFFDKVPLKPHQSYGVELKRKTATVCTEGSHTIIRIGEIKAADFSGFLEITMYEGSPLFDIAAVMSTEKDSTAIVYDGGLISNTKNFERISWTDVQDHMQQITFRLQDTSINQAVKYRTIIGTGTSGSIAIFPAPHQYFYPLDEAFNLHFTWYGNQYNKTFNGYGIGIRQDLDGDNRYVPWFNAPPKTRQRLHFFCYISEDPPATLMEQVKSFTHHDSYLPLPGYKTMASHFHNEHIMKVVLAGKPVADTPNFVKVFKTAGINIVHLAEFHYTAHPKGPDDQRLTELQTLFHECKRLSTNDFLLLPGEEPNEFFGGHWLAFFPRPVYWIMARKNEQPFVSNDPVFGKVYRIGNAAEMFELLAKENGLAWTAHARTKGSTGFPDGYFDRDFFLSDRFLGAAWKAMPADLSQPRLGKRVLDLMDDMNNRGFKKKILSEADLFSIEPENEMYAHLNVNYLQLDTMPSFDTGWQPVLNALQQGNFFSTTGEVLIPSFNVNGKTAGQTVALRGVQNATLSFTVQWTFPLHFAEIISGDGKQVYRQQIDLDETHAFGQRAVHISIDLSGKKWVRLEVWDIAANGAFTQTIWLQ